MMNSAADRVQEPDSADGAGTCNRKHALVTGTSSGIGRATVHRLAEAGFHVFSARRSPDDSGQAHDGDDGSAITGMVTPVVLDVVDPAARQRSVARVSDHVGDQGLDLLVNNAGIGSAAPMEVVDIASLRDIFEVNLFAQVAVTQAFLPQIRLARGRVVFMGSVGDHITMPFAGPLVASKRALAASADTLRQELSLWAIPVVVVEPGAVNTRAGDKLVAGARKVADELSVEHSRLYRRVFLDAVTASAAMENRGSDPDVVARTVLRAATEPRPRPRYLTGRFARVLVVLAAVLPTRALDKVRYRVLDLPRAGSDASRSFQTGRVSGG